MKAQYIAAAAATLLPLAFAQKAYIATVNSPSNASIHGQTVNANEGQFYIDMPTAAVCPFYDPDCDYNNVTIISGPSYTSNNSATEAWWLGILEAGGQELYTVLGPIGGSLYYTAAGSNNLLPYKAGATGFLSLGSTTDGRTKFIGPGGTDFYACPSDSAYFVLLGYESSVDEPLPAGCLAFEMIATETTAKAPQYYNCQGCQSRCYTDAPCTGYFE